jgi:predicted membrane-bound spermidine synthase
MAGLGVGAFFGGRIADKFPQNIITIFCLIELGVGCFGLFSYKLILSLQELLIYSNLFYTAIGSFLLLLFPTFLMGATLPILTAFFHQYIENIGESIGRLYFFNTLGAATGSLVTGFILFNYFTLSQTIYIAATLNIIIAFSIYFGYIGQKNDE